MLYITNIQQVFVRRMMTVYKLISDDPMANFEKNEPSMPLQNNLLENKSGIQQAISDNIIIHNLQSSTHLFPSCNQTSILFIYLETTVAVSFNPGSM